MRRPLDRHLPLLHRFQERGLRLGRRAIDLVGEEHVREHGSGAELELPRPLVVDRRTRDVRRHEVGRELHAAEPQAHHTGERARHQGLREAGNVVDQDVTVREETEQDQLEHGALADHRSFDLPEDLPRQLRDL